MSADVERSTELCGYLLAQGRVMLAGKLVTADTEQQDIVREMLLHGGGEEPGGRKGREGGRGGGREGEGEAGREEGREGEREGGRERGWMDGWRNEEVYLLQQD